MWMDTVQLAEDPEFWAILPAFEIRLQVQISESQTFTEAPQVLQPSDLD